MGEMLVCEASTFTAVADEQLADLADLAEALQEGGHVARLGENVGVGASVQGKVANRLI